MDKGTVVAIGIIVIGVLIWQGTTRVYLDNTRINKEKEVIELVEPKPTEKSSKIISVSSTANSNKNYWVKYEVIEVYDLDKSYLVLVIQTRRGVTSQILSERSLHNLEGIPLSK